MVKLYPYYKGMIVNLSLDLVLFLRPSQLQNLYITSVKIVEINCLYKK